VFTNRDMSLAVGTALLYIVSVQCMLQLGHSAV